MLCEITRPLAFIFAIWLLNGALSAEGAKLRIGIAAPAELASHADALLGELASNEELEFVERTNLDSIVKERRLELGAMAKPGASAPALTGAEALILMETLPDKDGALISTRVLSVALGIVLLHDATRTKTLDLGQWAKHLSKGLQQALPKLRVPREKAVAISLLNLRSTALARDLSMNAAASAFTSVVARRLAAEPQIFVLDRETMTETTWERGLIQIGKPALWSGSYLLDGTLPSDRNDTVVALRLLPPKTTNVPPIEFKLSLSLDAQGTAADLIARSVIAHLQALHALGKDLPTRPWDFAEEANAFFQEALWLHGQELNEAADRLITIAWELGRRTDEVKIARLKILLHAVAGRQQPRVGRFRGRLTGQPIGVYAGISDNEVFPLFRITATNRVMDWLLEYVPPQSLEARVLITDQPTFNNFVLEQGKWMLHVAIQVLKDACYRPDTRTEQFSDELRGLRSRVRQYEPFFGRGRFSEHLLVSEGTFTDDNPSLHTILAESLEECFKTLDDLLAAQDRGFADHWPEDPEQARAFRKTAYQRQRNYSNLRSGWEFHFFNMPNTWLIYDWQNRDEARADALYRAFVRELRSSKDSRRRVDGYWFGMDGCSSIEEARKARDEFIQIVWDQREGLNKLNLLEESILLAFVRPSHYPWGKFRAIEGAAQEEALMRLADWLGDHALLSRKVLVNNTRQLSLPQKTDQAVLDAYDKCLAREPSSFKTPKPKEPAAPPSKPGELLPAPIMPPVVTGRLLSDRMQSCMPTNDPLAPASLLVGTSLYILTSNNSMWSAVCELDANTLASKGCYPIADEMVNGCQSGACKFYMIDGKLHLGVPHQLWQLDFATGKWTMTRLNHEFHPAATEIYNGDIYAHGLRDSRTSNRSKLVSGVFRLASTPREQPTAFASSTRNPAINEWDARTPYPVFAAAPMPDQRILGLFQGRACSFDPSSFASRDIYSLPAASVQTVENAFQNRGEWRLHTRWDMSAGRLHVIAWNTVTGEWRLLVSPPSAVVMIQGNESAPLLGHPVIPLAKEGNKTIQRPDFIAGDYDGKRLILLLNGRGMKPFLAWWPDARGPVHAGKIEVTWNRRWREKEHTVPDNVFADTKLIGEQLSQVTLAPNGVLLFSRYFAGVLKLSHDELNQLPRISSKP